MLLVTRPARLQVTEQAASFFLLAAAVSAPRCRGDSRIRFFLLRRPPEQYAVTSTNHARPLELVPATELTSTARWHPRWPSCPHRRPARRPRARTTHGRRGLPPCSPAVRPPRPPTLQPNRASGRCRRRPAVGSRRPLPMRVARSRSRTPE